MEQQLRCRDFPLKPWESCLTGELTNKQTHTPTEITLKLLPGELLVNGTQRDMRMKTKRANVLTQEMTVRFKHPQDELNVDIQVVD